MTAEQIVLHRLWQLATEAYAAGVPQGRFVDLIQFAWSGQTPPPVSPVFFPVTGLAPAPAAPVDVRARHADVDASAVAYCGYDLRPRRQR